MLFNRNHKFCTPLKQNFKPRIIQQQSSSIQSKEEYAIPNMMESWQNVMKKWMSKFSFFKSKAHQKRLVSLILIVLIDGLYLLLEFESSKSIILIQKPEIAESMFAQLYQGDLLIQTAKEDAVLLVGKTHGGMSAAFNWILQYLMVGTGKKVNARYQIINKGFGKHQAEMSNGLTSKTFIPNIGELDAKTSLIDMAGFANNRNYIGVMGVSYFLKSVFEHVERVKFILVFPQIYLTGDCNNMLETISAFLNMFKQMVMPFQDQLFDSISFLMTRSKNPELSSQNLRNFIEIIRDQSFQFDEKHEIIKLLDQIASSNRITAFPYAIVNKNPPKCQIMENLTERGWKYFNLRRAEHKDLSQIINLPYMTDYKRLKQDDIQKFNKEIQQKIQNFEDSSQIISIAQDNFKQKWQKGITEQLYIDNWQNFIKNILNFDLLFAKIEHFINQTDKYSTQEMRFSINKPIVAPTLFKVFEVLIGIFKSASELEDLKGQAEDDFGKTMTNFKNCWTSLIDSFFVFCKNKKEHILLLRMKYIFERGIHEFIQFHKIDSETFFCARSIINKYLSILEDDTKSTYITFFMKSMNKKLVNRLINDENDCKEYQALLIKYQKVFEFSTVIEERELILNKSIEFLNAKCELFKKRLNLNKVTIEYLSVLKILIQLYSLIQIKLLNDEEKKTTMKQLFIQRLSYSCKVIHYLKQVSLNDIPNARILALNLAVHVEDIHQACEIYKLLITQAKNLEDRIHLLEQYANYCSKWGRLPQANTILQRKLSIFSENCLQTDSIKKKLLQLAQNQNYYRTEYIQLLKELNTVPLSDPSFIQIIKNIEDAIKLNSSRSQSLNQSALISIADSINEGENNGIAQWPNFND